MKTIAFLCAFCVVSGAATAGGTAELNRFLSIDGTVQGQFSQHVQDKNGKPLDEDASGRFIFSRPGKFKWVYERPYEQEIISNGKKLWVWDKDLAQVTIRDAQKSLPASPAAILFGSGAQLKDWKVKDSGSKDGLQWVSLEPTKSMGGYSDVRIGFSNGVPARMVFTGPMGEISQLEFNQVKASAGVHSQQFEFKAPKGTDILEVPD